MASVPDWDKGLPFEMVAKIASHSGGAGAMRRVCKSWQEGFDSQAMKIILNSGCTLDPLSEPLFLRFPSLISLDIGESQTAPSALQLLFGLKKLLSLSLGSSLFSLVKGSLAVQLRDRDLQYLRGLSLTSLDLQACSGLKGTSLEILRGMPITRLNMARGGTGVDLGFLDYVPLLKDFSSPGYMTEAGMKCLARMPITSLALENADNAPWMSLMRGLPLTHLQVLCFKDPRILENLRGMPLTSLDIRGGFLRGEELAYLRGMPLKRLLLSSCAWAERTDEVLSFLRGMQLTELSLENTRFTDNVLTDHLLGMPLTNLNLKNCELSQHGVRHLVSLPLTFLNLSGCTEVDDVSLVYLGQIKSLLYLNLSGCSKLTEGRLHHLWGAPMIRLLDVRGCPRLTWAGIEVLLEMKVWGFEVMWDNPDGIIRNPLLVDYEVTAGGDTVYFKNWKGRSD